MKLHKRLMFSSESLIRSVKVAPGKNQLELQKLRINFVNIFVQLDTTTECKQGQPHRMRAVIHFDDLVSNLH